MSLQTRSAKLEDIIKDSAHAVRIARNICKSEDETEMQMLTTMRLGVLNTHFDVCSELGKAQMSVDALEECLQIYRPYSEIGVQERGGQPDENLIFYLHSYSIQLEKIGKLQESIEAHKESLQLINSDP